MALENPATVDTWGRGWLFGPEEWGTGGGGLMGFDNFMPPGFPRIGGFEQSGFVPAFGTPSRGGSNGLGGPGAGQEASTLFGQMGNDATSGFSLASLGGLFGSNDSSNNGMGDLYNFLLSLGSGKGGAGGTNLFSGIEV